MQNPEYKYLTTQQICDKYDLSPKTIRRYEADGLIPSHQDAGKTGKKYYLESEVTAWFEARALEGSELEKAELRKKIADAGIAETKLAVMKGELVAIDDVIPVIAAELSIVRAKLLNLPGLIAPHIYVDNINSRIKIVEDAVRQVLEELKADRMARRELNKAIELNKQG